jgi:hypothetical protein
MKKGNRNIKKSFLYAAFLTKSRKGVVAEYLPWLLIGLVLLVIVLISIFFLKEKGVSLIDQLKSIFRRG